MVGARSLEGPMAPPGWYKGSQAQVLPAPHCSFGETFEILASIPRLHDDLVFPARGQNNPVSGYSKWKRKLDQVSGAKNWTLHDLRRTAATGMAALGVAPHVVERILNHTTGTLGGVAGIYNRFAYLPEMADGLELWSRHLDRLIAGAASIQSVTGHV